MVFCHPPHGGCGLKFAVASKNILLLPSPSTRRVWIEIKSSSAALCSISSGHPPHGGCGLKWVKLAFWSIFILSPSTRRVWIEITAKSKTCRAVRRHPPHGGCGLKFQNPNACLVGHEVTLHTEGVD